MFSDGLTVYYFSFMSHSCHLPSNYYGILEVYKLLTEDLAFQQMRSFGKANNEK